MSKIHRTARLQTNTIKRSAKNEFNELIKQNTYLGNKMCLIFANPYYGTSYELGDPVLEDGIMTYHAVKRLGYNTYMASDTDMDTFLSLFRLFISHGYESLIIYYSGHGSNTPDRNHDESDGCDETFVATDGLIIDDTLNNLITKYNKSEKLILISDSCHSGTVYDLPKMNNVVSISACLDRQYATQLGNNGIFTYYFWKYAKSNTKISDIMSDVNNNISPYNQSCVTSNPEYIMF